MNRFEEIKEISMETIRNLVAEIEELAEELDIDLCMCDMIEIISGIINNDTNSEFGDRLILAYKDELNMLIHDIELMCYSNNFEISMFKMLKSWYELLPVTYQ